jgi:hypothetical protein
MSDLKPKAKWLPWLLIVSVLLGILLRFAWTSDMEYRYDEHYMFDRSQAIGVTEPWPMLGMPSGVGMRNPGMSIWIFVAIARVAGVSTPVGLVRGVVLLNCLALLALALGLFRFVREKDREPWIWATILLAVNPTAIQLERKIWAQSVLPLFSVLFLWSWMRRRTWAGAFCWGLIGAILGQIHMSGFFFAAAIFLWSLWSECEPGRPQVRWPAWLLGSVLGSLPMVPWFGYAFTHAGTSAKAPLKDLLEFSYWRNWVCEPAGLAIGDSVGLRHLKDFMSWPELAGHATYGVGIAHGIGLVASLCVLGFGFSALWRDRARAGSRWRGEGSDTARAVNAGLWGHGGLMNLARVYAHRHYLIVALPLQYVWFAGMGLARGNAERGRRLLMLLWGVQLAISIGFLTYIHFRGGAPGGPYGVAYRLQDHNAPFVIKD